ncbi:MAG: hypothetical protein NTZ44_03905 [Candidatus Nomurabacteria bacterium]|nr:hypothetical protein [Candidatus Nomurabacteria bacterium]
MKKLIKLDEKTIIFLLTFLNLYISGYGGYEEIRLKMENLRLKLASLQFDIKFTNAMFELFIQVFSNTSHFISDTYKKENLERMSILLLVNFPLTKVQILEVLQTVEYCKGSFSSKERNFEYHKFLLHLLDLLFDNKYRYAIIKKELLDIKNREIDSIKNHRKETEKRKKCSGGSSSSNYGGEGRH